MKRFFSKFGFLPWPVSVSLQYSGFAVVFGRIHTNGDESGKGWRLKPRPLLAFVRYF